MRGYASNLATVPPCRELARDTSENAATAQGQISGKGVGRPKSPATAWTTGLHKGYDCNSAQEEEQ